MNRIVPFFDWKKLYLEDREKYLQIIDETLKKGKFILQDDVEEFEHKLKNITGRKYAVAVSDGTNALLLGLRASEIGPGDEVILPGHSFIAAAQSIHFVGAVPVPVEIDETDWLICPDAIEAAITPRTKAVMAVHVNGRICQMDRICAIAEKYGLEVFEDSAQAPGASLDGCSAGAFGRWGTFSFYPSNTLGCFGDAGGLVTDDFQIFERVRAMRNHGANESKSISLDTKFWGTNSRMDNLHAAILSYKIDWYKKVMSRLREIASRYNDVLKNIAMVRLPPEPDSNSGWFDVYQNYKFCYPERDKLRTYLSDRGIGTIIQWGGFGIHELNNLGMGEKAATDRPVFRRMSTASVEQYYD